MVKELITKTRKELYKIRNLGGRCIDEIETKLNNLGLSFKAEDDSKKDL